MYSISELFIYPIKSLGGISIKESAVTRLGLQFDRHWMLVDENNRFITQRENRELALLQVGISETDLTVTHKLNKSTIEISFTPQTEEEAIVTVFSDACLAQFVNKEADKWFSEILKLKCRLVFMPEKSLRFVDNKYAHDHEITSFSDGYPTLIIGEAALDKLNSLLPDKININRFRPNIVFKGGEAHDEDEMAHLSINNIDFFGVKLCSRCGVPTINQETGESGKEPTRTLAQYRAYEHKIKFGQNLLHKGAGLIKVGDAINVLKKTVSPFKRT